MTVWGGALLGVMGTLMVVLWLWLIYEVYKRGNQWARSKVQYYWYRIYFRAHMQDCITCDGKGERPMSGGIEGITGVVGGQELMWECVWCDGTGKEKASYTYRFGWLFRLLRITKTPIEFERDQQEAERVLGDARNRLTIATGVEAIETNTGGDDVYRDQTAGEDEGEAAGTRS